MAVKKIKDYKCPFCGSTEFARGRMVNRLVQKSANPMHEHIVYAQICRHCGTLIREFIVNPDELPDY